jgi:hypothetical protein
MLHAQYRTEDIGIECRRVAFRGLLGHRAGLTFGTCVVDRDVEPAKSLDGSIDQASHLFFVTHVGADKLRFATHPA